MYYIFVTLGFIVSFCSFQPFLFFFCGIIVAYYFFI